jgi:ATP-dependent Clp protease ATP-binding subunit ClpX
MLPSPEQIVTHLDRHVIGHEAAKRMLATACYDHLMQCAATDLMGGRVWLDNNCIIAGPSGCGKSALIQVLGDFLCVPVLQIDCTILTPNGYKGRNLSQIIDDLEKWLVQGGSTMPALVVWEEVDKLQSCGDDAGRYREMIQADTLRFLDGTMCGEEGTLDASRILSIGCGAFSGLDQIRSPDSIARIGFPTATVVGETEDHNRPGDPLEPEHLVQFGLITEFVGRFSRFELLDAIDRSVMRRIITDSESSVLGRKMAQFGLHGVRLVFDGGAIDAVADMAIAHPTGARGLRMILGRVLGDWEFQLPGLAESGVTEICFDGRAVRGDGPPVITRATDRNVSESLNEARRKAGSYSGKAMRKGGDDLSIF